MIALREPLQRLASLAFPIRTRLGSRPERSGERSAPLAGRYIADFLAPSARLVVEVDGASHRGRTQADARRDRVLTRLGYRVLRLEAGVVLYQPAIALARIQAAIAGD